ncbi:Mannose-6-phosphate isomerase 2 [Hibiscus syriacus]|uniref:mannose-6-phosphate isomerase n=1 Tax=Hibiscus syriacus TaxID=106335 RepID=A0A6A2WAN6_HIBSY|nr:mannose-6-phosphate isomerase 2-like [Hibiscus syriacus]KAE8654962.1 Mannose-6-phosphate isomerase 2 [Hibiscus syriacus]
MAKANVDQKLKRLRAWVQNYEWGRSGAEAEVARLMALNSGAEIDPNKPYAELWVGTHESGPSVLVDDDEQNVGLTLKEWTEKNPNVLGAKVLEKWGSHLPFLFKVLSVGKALSIQAHPDKEMAKELHKMNPNLYKDDNHKPEMALAITPFTSLCGFISLHELKQVLEDVPEIVQVIGIPSAKQVMDIQEHGGAATEEIKSALRSVFTQLMSASKEMTTNAISKLKTRLLIERQLRSLREKEELVLELEKQYPGDIGVLSAFLLNYVKLKAGEALYVAANEPHAYLRGDCIECMATSDNVVRAGLTPKHRDVQILCSMLTYNQGYPEILAGLPLSPYITRYLPPFDEFEVDRCVLPKGSSAVFPAVPGPSVFLAFAGEGTFKTGSCGGIVTEGDVMFGPANTEITITATARELQIYRAGINSRFFHSL